jgi:holliday junction DNA helicase RuvA
VIALLRGRVVSATLGELILDVNGVGYLIRVVPGAGHRSPGAELTLHTYLAVREDALTLYGFADQPARNLFETLLGVTGVGPKLALAALGTLGADGLRRAVLAEDVAALTVVPGVGRKIVARMVLELREKLGAAGPPEGVPGGPGPRLAGTRAEVAQALTALGYAAAETTGVLDRMDIGPDEPPEEVLRAALRSLGGAA